MTNDEYQAAFKEGWQAHKSFLAECDELDRGSAFGIMIVALGLTMFVIDGIMWLTDQYVETVTLVIAAILVPLGLLIGHKERQRNIRRRAAFSEKWNGHVDV